MKKGKRRWLGRFGATFLIVALVYAVYLGALRFRIWNSAARLESAYGAVPVDAFTAPLSQAPLPDIPLAPAVPIAPGYYEVREGPITPDDFPLPPGKALPGKMRTIFSGAVASANEQLPKLRSGSLQLYASAADRFNHDPLNPWSGAYGNYLNGVRLLFADAALAVDDGDFHRAERDILRMFGMAGECADVTGPYAVRVRKECVYYACKALERLLAGKPGNYPEIEAAIDSLRTNTFLVESIKWDLASRFALFNLPFAEQTELGASEFGDLSRYAPLIMGAYRAGGLMLLDHLYLTQHYGELLAFAEQPCEEWLSKLNQLPTLPSSQSVLFHYAAVLGEDGADGIEVEADTQTLLDLALLLLDGAGESSGGDEPNGPPQFGADRVGRTPPGVTKGRYTVIPYRDGWAVFVKQSEPLKSLGLTNVRNPVPAQLDELVVDARYLLIVVPFTD